MGGDDEQNIGGTDLLPGLVNPLPDQEPLLDLRCPVCGKHPCICIKEVDCENLAPLAGDNSVATSSLYNEVTGLAQFSEFLNAVAGSSVEHGTTGYRDADGALQLMMPYTDGQTNSVGRLEPRCIQCGVYSQPPAGHSLFFDGCSQTD